MIDWYAISRRLGFESEKAMWTALYFDDPSAGLESLAEYFSVTKAVIRTALAQAGVPRKSRGGSHNAKSRLLTPDECRRLRQEGLPHAKRRLNVPYLFLFNLLRRSEMSAGLVIEPIIAPLDGSPLPSPLVDPFSEPEQ